MKCNGLISAFVAILDVLVEIHELRVHADRERNNESKHNSSQDEDLAALARHPELEGVAQGPVLIHGDADERVDSDCHRHALHEVEKDAGELGKRPVGHQVGRDVCGWDAEQHENQVRDG